MKLMQVLLYSNLELSKEFIEKYYDKIDNYHLKIKEEVLEKFRKDDESPTYDFDKIPEDLKKVCMCKGLEEKGEIQIILNKFSTEENKYSRTIYVNPFKIVSDRFYNFIDKEKIINEIKNMKSVNIEEKIIDEKVVYEPPIESIKDYSVVNSTVENAVEIINKENPDFLIIT